MNRLYGKSKSDSKKGHRQRYVAPQVRLAQLARGKIATTTANGALLPKVFRRSDRLCLFASNLPRIHSKNPDQGFSMTFGDTKVTIEGENLTPLFHYIREHRAVEIVEAERTLVLSSEVECVVSGILGFFPT